MQFIFSLIKCMKYFKVDEKSIFTVEFKQIKGK